MDSDWKSKIKLARALAVCAGVLAFSGCATALVSEPGSLTGVELAGGVGVCGPEDRHVLVDTFDMNFLGLFLASGSLRWDPTTRTVGGLPDVDVDWTRQEKVLDTLHRIAETYDSDLCGVEINESSEFKVGMTAMWENFAFWLFPWHEVSASAVLKKREAVR